MKQELLKGQWKTPVESLMFTHQAKKLGTFTVSVVTKWLETNSAQTSECPYWQNNKARPHDKSCEEKVYG